MFKGFLVALALTILWGFIAIALNLPALERYIGYICASIVAYYIAKKA